MPGKFPGPYKNDTNADDPIMKRVPMKTLDIGARTSGLPKGIGADSMGIEHVGGSAGGPVHDKLP